MKKWLRERGAGAGFGTALFALLVILDQFTKRLAVAGLRGKAPFVLLPGVLELDYLENRGSAFGMLQNQKLFILLVSAVFMAVLLWVKGRMPYEKRYFLPHILLVMIMAGGIGNMYDRIAYSYVIDFISFVWIHFPVFNVADIYVTLGTFGVAFLLAFVYRDEDLAFLALQKNPAGKEQ